MNRSTKLLATAGVLGTLTLAGCGPAYDGSYGGYGGSGSYDNTYNTYDRRYDYSYGRSYYDYGPRYSTYDYGPRYSSYRSPRRNYYDEYDRRYYRRW